MFELLHVLLTMKMTVYLVLFENHDSSSITHKNMRPDPIDLYC